MNSTTPQLIDKDIVERAMHLTPYDIDHALLHSGFRPLRSVSATFLGIMGNRSFAYETTFVDDLGETITGRVYVSVVQKPITEAFYFIAKY